jgi:hypothetical protein
MILLANGELKEAGEVTQADILPIYGGASERVESVKDVHGEGFYNPHVAGNQNFVVNGIVSTGWTSAISPRMGHALLSPVEYLLAKGIDVSSVARACQGILKSVVRAFEEE